MRKSLLWKKAVATAVCAIMTASLAACGGSGSSDADDKKASGDGEPIEIKVATWNADENLGGDKVLEDIEKKLNIKITPVNVTWDDYKQKIQLWSSSGSLPDVFVGDFRTTATYSEWAVQGVIKQIPEDLSDYPNLQEYLAEDATENAKIDGGLYCIPRKTYDEQAATCIDREILYRWDLAQKAGVTKEPETWDEFISMIETIIEKDPDGKQVAGMTAHDKTLLSGMLLPYANKLVATSSLDFKWVKADDGTYQPAYFAIDPLPAFELGRKMYESGVIEKDIALTTNQSADEKFLQGKSAALIGAGGYADKYKTLGKYWNDVYGHDFTEDVKALNLMPDKDGNPAYPVWDYAWSESYINAEVSGDKLEKILELYDYLLSDEGAFLSTYGYEGETYEMVDGKISLLVENVKDSYPSTDSLSTLVRWNPSNYDERFVSQFPVSYVENDKKLIEQAREVEIPEYEPACTPIMLKSGLDFGMNCGEDFINIITGTESVETMWKAIVEKYENNGLNDAIDYINEEMKK